MALLDTMKKVAEQSQNANVPAAFLFGNVTATSPLTIRVDNRFDITGEAIVVMKEFTVTAASPIPRLPSPKAAGPAIRPSLPTTTR